ncbi:phospholipase D family protein [Rhizobium sp. 32-5/1]|uniref:phospholipase D family protein n=1 Tax=Rhizobium sp. 32-5/1 TaxID=3019602 RepID=UPI00240DDD68|nr:phospholipase D family protein [Rhizobium sp. 32-5/1]WEZ85224.1 phospholipase D family protein [Rhizobium sp. 32-5/1]
MQILAVLLTAGLAVIAGIYAWGRYGRRPRGAESSVLPTADDATMLDRLGNPLVVQHAGENGLSLLSGNVEAFVARALSSRSAGRSLDLQYYYWKNDLTGRLLTREVLAAADRGVRVRLLLDDINAGLHDRMCLALDAHPNIEVRLFNPSRARTDRFRRGVEMVLRAFSATRRMHNKAWIADGRVVITGGRNIGDAYFDAADDSNFHDLDVWMLGPIAEEAGAIFDRYWNSQVVLPIRALRTPRAHYLPSLRRKLEKRALSQAGLYYLAEIEKAQVADSLWHGSRSLHWTRHARIVADPPEKAHLQKRQNWLMRELMPVLHGARKEVRIISPYFIPGSNGTGELARLVDAKVDVSVLTNSLAATDVAAVHGAYANYRKALLRSGVALYELKADTVNDDQQRMSLFGSRIASLHTKAFVVDGAIGFVGSMNFDPRSASLNTEMGVLFEHVDLLSEVRAIFDEETAPHNSFRLSLDKGRLRWHDEYNGNTRTLKREPEAGFLRRLTAGVIGILPIESQL